MPNIVCPNRIICDCIDDPTGNFSSEAVDVDRTPAMVDVSYRPPLGTLFSETSCLGICFSEVSYEEAYLCAYEAALVCIFSDWKPPGSEGTPTTFSYFGNNAATCTIRCSDGTVCGPGDCIGEATFFWTIAAGTIFATSQAEANLQAGSLACRRARQHAICFITASIAPVCLEQAYSVQLRARGGTPWTYPYLAAGAPFGCTEDTSAGDRTAYAEIPYNWAITSGSLPDGLELRSCTGIIKGTPTESGTFSFTVRITDAIGSYQTKTFTLCVVEITTASPLTEATIDVPYSRNLSQTPAEQETEIWSLTAGALPAGLTLSSAGVLSGTPTEEGDFSFTAGVSVECPTLRGGVCIKEFELTVGGVPPSVNFCDTPPATITIPDTAQLQAGWDLFTFFGDGPPPLPVPAVLPWVPIDGWWHLDLIKANWTSYIRLECNIPHTGATLTFYAKNNGEPNEMMGEAIFTDMELPSVAALFDPSGGVLYFPPSWVGLSVTLTTP